MKQFDDKYLYGIRTYLPETLPIIDSFVIQCLKMPSDISTRDNRSDCDQALRVVNDLSITDYSKFIVNSWFTYDKVRDEKVLFANALLILPTNPSYAAPFVPLTNAANHAHKERDLGCHSKLTEMGAYRSMVRMKPHIHSSLKAMESKMNVLKETFPNEIKYGSNLANRLGQGRFLKNPNKTQSTFGRLATDKELLTFVKTIRSYQLGLDEYDDFFNFTKNFLCKNVSLPVTSASRSWLMVDEDRKNNVEAEEDSLIYNDTSKYILNERSSIASFYLGTFFYDNHEYNVVQLTRGFLNPLVDGYSAQFNRANAFSNMHGAKRIFTEMITLKETVQSYTNPYLKEHGVSDSSEYLYPYVFGYTNPLINPLSVIKEQEHVEEIQRCVGSSHDDFMDFLSKL